MRKRPVRNRSGTRLVALGALTVALGAASGCTAASTPSADATPAASTAVTRLPDAGQPCVADPTQVVDAQPTAQMMSGDLPADQVAELHAAAKSALTRAVPGAVVGVRSPAGTWTQAYGKADPTTGTRMAVGVHTRIGSITKTFTATVVLQLAESGRLSLEDPIDKYVSGVPNGDRINLRRLASMTSGVGSYTRSKKFTDRYFAKPETVFTPAELLKVGVSESPLFEPGEQFDYSNTNTILLGMVIEKVTGAPVEQAMQTGILDPLELTNTSWPGTSTKLPEPYAQGYTLQGDRATPDKPENATHWNQAWGWTAGELISDIDDLLTYGRALGTGQGLLDAKSQTARLTSFPTPGGYGFGFGCVAGWVGHAGELPGYNTSLFYDTTSDTTVAVQVNSDIASGDCEASPTLTDDPRDRVCSSPATRIFVALSSALGNTFTPPPAR
jgi:D-alanyl-D-alanine carboxypeptidase